MKRVFQGNDFELVLSVMFLRMLTCEFNRRFIGLSPTVTEKNLRGKRVFRQALSQGHLVGNPIEIRSVKDFLRLLLNRLHNRRVFITQGIHR